MKKIFFIFFLALGFLNCTQTQDKMIRHENLISLQDVASDNAYKLVNLYPNEDMTFGIDSDGRIFGYTGMNRFFGKASINNGNIKISKLMTTKVNVNRDSFIKEEIYLSLLKSMTNIKFIDNKLILSNNLNQTLEFTK